MAKEVSKQNLEDPAAPLSDLETMGGLDAAIALSNYGADGPQTFEDVTPFIPPTLPIDWAKIVKFLDACESSDPRVGYKLGAKIPSDAAQPGKDFTHVDCSGFVRAAIRRATNPKAAKFPDGSVVQHDWIKAEGFASGKIADGSLKDDIIRIAFLSPHDAPSKIGHVALLRNGKTVESRGGKGPDSRKFDGSGWQAKAKIYVLAK